MDMGVDMDSGNGSGAVFGFSGTNAIKTSNFFQQQQGIFNQQQSSSFQQQQQQQSSRQHSFNPFSPQGGNLPSPFTQNSQHSQAGQGGQRRIKPVNQAELAAAIGDTDAGVVLSIGDEAREEAPQAAAGMRLEPWWADISEIPPDSIFDKSTPFKPALVPTSF